MLSRRQFISTLALASVGGCRVLQNVKPPASAAVQCCWKDGLEPQTIAIVGDVQRTGILEMSMLGRTQNDREREAILAAIAKDAPDMMLMLGDQVVLGDAEEGWNYFDRIMTPIHQAGIPVRAMLGNHDYEGSLHDLCVSNFCDRFPHQRNEHHGLVMLGRLALITLDSNFEHLGESGAEAQARRYEELLHELDENPDVRGVVVASHHPPYTNSDLSGSSELRIVRNMFAAPFLAARKTRLYLSGHIHSYERFVSGDKTFVISGGGGGPRREVSISKSRPYTNDAYRKEVLRPFHYIRMKVREDALNCEVMMLRKKSSRDFTFSAGDRFSVGLYG